VLHTIIVLDNQKWRAVAAQQANRESLLPVNVSSAVHCRLPALRCGCCRRQRAVVHLRLTSWYQQNAHFEYVCLTIPCLLPFSHARTTAT